MKKRFWALLLAVMMVVSVLPTAAFAVDAEPPVEGKVTATKTLVCDNKGKPVVDEDGCYTIKLTVQGNPVTTNAQPNADVVLVVDNSGSMASSVGEPCETEKAQFKKVKTIELTTWITQTGLVWDIYECPKCRARYVLCKLQVLGGHVVDRVLYDDRPDVCTGEVGSGSRMEAAIGVSNEFARSILAVKGNRVAVIGFAHQEKDGGANDTGAIKVAEDLTDNLELVKYKIDSMEAEGGTNYTAALEKAYNYLNNRSNKESRPGYVVFISDGAPGRSGESFDDPDWNGKEQIAALKNDGITVYTVGIALDDSAANYLKSMASDEQDEHFINVTGTEYKEQLKNTLKQWAAQIKKVPAGTNAVMTDIVDISRFTIVDYDSKLVRENDGKLIWNIGDIPEKTTEVTITVKANEGVYGDRIPTNKDVYLTYTPAGSNEQKKIPESVIGKPTVTIAAPETYSVTYTYEPAGVPAAVPVDQNTYSVGQLVTVAARPADAKVGGGTWKFQKWTLKGDEVSANNQVPMAEGGLHFVGVWEYEADKPAEYPVTYTYAPEGVPAEAPTNPYTYSVGQKVTVAARPDDVKVGGGTWKFQKWTLDGVVVFANNQVAMREGGLHFIGVWEYEEEIKTLSITKTADDTSVYVGDKVTYTITVKNEGNVDLTDVKVTDTFVDGGTGKLTVKAGNMEIGTLAVGAEAKIELEYTTTSDDRNGLKNTAMATANGVEGKSSSVDVTVKSEPITPVGPSKPQLNYEDHYAYVVGYPDGLVHPERNITRAEVATIFFRMLLDESREYFWAQENDFSDVAETDWFNNAVSTLANAQLINGYPDGSYRPNANITRAEFATIAIRFFLDEDVEIEENNLSDVKGHWAEANINLAYALELINGYPDGTFRPDQKITRAEAMAIVNRVLKRAPEKDHLLKDMIEWPDNLNTAAWYYADVQEATNSHKFHMDKEEEYEIWTELLPVRDWVALEQEWSKANSSKNPGEVVDIKITTPEAGDNGLKLD